MSGNNVLEYWIRAKDATAGVLANATQRVKDFAKTVTASMRKTQTAMSDGFEPEKFINTTNVLDSVGRALDRLGVSGEQFEDVYDTLARRLNDFNKTGENSAALFEHFKASMADVGMNEKQIASGLAMLQRNMKQVGVAGAEAGKEMRSGFKVAHLALAGLQGNVYAAGRAFSFLLGHIKKLNLSANALTGVSLAVYAITEVVSKCVNWWKEKKKRLEEIQQLKFEQTLKDYQEAQKDVNAQLATAERHLANELEKKKTLIDHNAKLMSQEIELARLRAVEGKTGQEREDINADFAAQQAALKSKVAIEKAELEAAGKTQLADVISDLEAKLQPKLAKLKAEYEKVAQEVDAKEKEKRGRLAQEQTLDHLEAGGYGGGLKAVYRTKTSQEQEEDFAEWAVSDEEYMKVKERRDKLKEAYEDILADLERFKEKKEKAQADAANAKFDAEAEKKDYELEQWAKYDEQMAAYYEEVQRQEQAAHEQAMRYAEQEAEAKKRLEEQLYHERISNAQSVLAELQKAQSSATSRLSNAQSKVSQAWGWYRDPSSMQSKIDDYLGQKEAEKQFEKDFERLRSKHSDWRRLEMGQLTAGEEATKQVALAKEEEKAAQKALETIAEEAATQSQYLAQLVEEYQAAQENDYAESLSENMAKTVEYQDRMASALDVISSAIEGSE